MIALSVLRKCDNKSWGTLNCWAWYKNKQVNNSSQTSRVTKTSFCLCACIHVHAPSGGLSKISSDPMKAVNDAVDESSNIITGIVKFAANLIAPDDDEGSWLYERIQILWLQFIWWYASFHFSLFFSRNSICSQKKRFVLILLWVHIPFKSSSCRIWTEKPCLLLFGLLFHCAALHVLFSALYILWGV